MEVTGRPTRNGSRIFGVGACRPARVVGNHEVCGPIGSSDEWVRQRSGIVSRRFAAPEETVIAMASAAGCKAIAASGIAPEQVDTVLFASMSYLYQSPAAAPQVAHQVGARASAALDLHAACAGFCYALAVADSLVRAGSSEHVLVIGAEKMTDIIDPADRATAFLFGDGAGAVVVGPASCPGMGPVVWGSDGSRAGLIAHNGSWLVARDHPGEWPTMRMSGPEIYRWALQEIAPVARQALVEVGLTPHDLTAFVPHQANLRIVEAIARSLDLPPHVAVARSLVTDGNTSAASIPLALEHLISSGQAISGGRALLVGFGAGLAYAALVVTLP
jgi:3-oxoacyl-[acyl-carrier-protein] synthase III